MKMPHAANGEIRRLRIAFIGGRGVGSAYSGIERYYEEIGSRLATRGHRVLVYCRSYFSPKLSVYRGMELVRLGTLRTKHLETLLHSALATIDVCFRRIDIVQFHALGSSPFCWLPRLFGKKTIVSVRGLDWQRAKWKRLARAYLRFCENSSVHCPNATVVVSKVLQCYFESRFKRGIKYIPNGVGFPELSSPRRISRWGLEHRNYLLYAGRVSPEKGLDVLIEAHRTMAGRPLLVIAGGSSYSEDYIESLRSKAGPDVVFTGFQEGETLKELYSNAMAFVLPSQMEGLSVALLEAMAYGLPVVASDIPENRELVDECGGFLFKVDEVASLRRVLEKVMRDKEGAFEVGKNARKQVCKYFSWDRITVETESFYRDLQGGSVKEPSVIDEAEQA